jgi:methyl-accepting chemotaxis protein
MSQAYDRAEKIKRQSQSGSQTVQQAIEAMDDIKKSSSEIRQITSLIDEISFQTNLLALNARVEAARAGEAGRGFAVVAAEVQQLAARSAKAASDISQLIAQSAQQVEKGAEIVNKGGDALKSIASGVFDITETISNASSQSKEQARSIREINSTTATLDTTMQEIIHANDR